jgi:hypothetical protein
MMISVSQVEFGSIKFDELEPAGTGLEIDLELLLILLEPITF